MLGATLQVLLPSVDWSVSPLCGTNPARCMPSPVLCCLPACKRPE